MNTISISTALSTTPQPAPGAPTDSRDLLTVHEVAQQLRVDDSTVRRWIKGGMLPAVVLPRRSKRQAYRIRRSTIAHLLGDDSQ